jgi:hypothetical protein
MLQLGNGINVVLRRIRSNSAGHWIFHGLFPTPSLKILPLQENCKQL